jgi:hypothetical protein
MAAATTRIARIIDLRITGRPTDRALSCRPPRERTTAHPAAARRIYPEPGGRPAGEPGRPTKRRPVSSSALLGGRPPHGSCEGEAKEKHE